MSNPDDDIDRVERELDALLDDLGLAKKPVDHGFEATELARARADGELERILKEPQRGHAVLRSAFRARRTTYLLATATLCIVVLVAAVALVTTVDSNHPAMAAAPPMLDYPESKDGRLPLVGEPAGPVLVSLANEARAQVDPKVDGKAQHVRQVGWWLETTDSGTAKAKSHLVPTVTDSYFLPDGRVRVKQSTGEPLDANGREPAPVKTGPVTSDETFTGPPEGPGYAASLPVDPDKLVSTIAPGADGCADARTFCIANSLIQLGTTYVLPPRLLAAYWQALSSSTDATVLGTVRDRLDRSAIAIAVPGSEPSHQLILLANPTTGAFLGYDEILVAPDAEVGLRPPAVVALTALTDVGPVSIEEATAS